ncbi:Hypothetical protein PP7435_CHR2-2650 [Komagataella phaffii CBS 7435]|uniref:Uncharacterized protein n=1 Tax=Komagataella phaffii (strain ATCC 76273 / CBS 7435 / CECT 11047 / NRRL Y-11430 / Wegner 21-1) TaxID=981350 RepID=A0A1G4KQ54_KOMPC|nr:Hypothetical protein BQ9382_C2-6522 [Komagataella phaffii CBS 7435]SCV12120.1 Hypothetical protein PP7435_CHR2-2650 [Komagataella phaffii CBS 7435]
MRRCSTFAHLSFSRYAYRWLEHILQLHNPHVSAFDCCNLHRQNPCSSCIKCYLLLQVDLNRMTSTRLRSMLLLTTECGKQYLVVCWFDSNGFSVIS